MAFWDSDDRSRGWTGFADRSREWAGEWQSGRGWREESGEGWRGERAWDQGQDNRSCRFWWGDPWQSSVGKSVAGSEQGQDSRAPAVAATDITAAADGPQSRPPGLEPAGPIVPPVAEVYDMGYFRNVAISTHYKEHNIALKWFRDVCEREGRSVKRFPIRRQSWLPR